MAYSGVIYGTTTGNSSKYETGLWWYQENVDVKNNTSNIRMELWARSVGASYTTTATWKPKINNNTLPDKYAVVGIQWVLLGSYTAYNVKHNDDGSLSYNISASFTGTAGGSLSLTGGTVNGSAQLEKIPRSSIPTSNLPKIYFGDTVRISFNSASSSFRHTLEYSIAGKPKETVIVMSTGTYQDVTIPFLAVQGATNTDVQSLIFYLTTYYTDGSIVGTTQGLYTNVYVPENIVPKITSITTTIDKKLGYNGAIQNVTSVSMTPTIEIAYFSQIKNYQWKVNDRTLTTKDISFTPDSTTSKITLKVTDERNRTGTYSFDLEAHPYAKPVSSFNFYRSDDLGNAQIEGENVKVTPTYTFSDIEGLNNPTVDIQINSGLTVVDSFNGSLATGTSIILGKNNVLKTKQYDIVVKVTDKLGNESISSNIITIAEVLLNIPESGRALAIGTFSNSGDREMLRVGWESLFEKDLSVEGNLVVKGTVIEAISSDSTSNTQWVKFPDGTMIVNQRLTASLSGNAFGGQYYSSQALGNFPIPFASDTIYPQVTVKQSGGNASGFSLAGTQSRNSAGVVYVYSPASFSSMSFEIFVTTIGRWK